MFYFRAQYYDGKTSRTQTLHIHVNEQGLLLSDAFGDIAIVDIDIRPRIGNTTRKIYLPKGAYLESHDNDVLDKICRHWQVSRKERYAHFLESNYRFVVFALIVLIIISVGGVKYGIPAASKEVAHWLPLEIDQALGKNVMPELDDNFFKPSKLTQEQQNQVIKQFNTLLTAVSSNEQQDIREYRLLFRASPLVGANAFALPDGTIVMTDELVYLVDDPELLSGILLHEIGHVKHRHSLQTLIRQASFSVLIVAFTGDVSSASSLALLLPALLVQAEYSREFEYESDTYALNAMKRLNIPTEYFSIAMEKMLAIDESTSKEEQNTNAEISLFQYFSTHPPTQERIDRFRQQSSEE